MSEPRAEDPGLFEAFRSNAWTDLALTLPVFIGYHLGVVMLNVRNAADFFTSELIAFADKNLLVYWGLVVGIGMAMIVLFATLGRGAAFDWRRFFVVLLEGAVYAVLMRGAAVAAIGSLPLAATAIAPAADARSVGLIMSLGAGFYEEVAFRVGLFGLGTVAVRAFFGGVAKWTLVLGWGVVAAAVFSGWHYVGPLGDAFELR
ncbi:MAG: CPBP family intramembrane metalloprotease, partial [Myxococcales bacterium]|nr:CPBP family intramembrane metalloprotease [Myxococcales bacterium]